MTNPVTPATDEEVEHERNCWRDNPTAWAMRLIARIDAERARAEALYASVEDYHHKHVEAVERAERAEEAAQHAREESNSGFDAAATHLARAERAEAERDRLHADLDAYRTAREAFGKTVQGGARAHDAAAALMVERDRLRAALELVSLRQEPDGPCWCVFQIPKGSAHHITCSRARALLGEVKP